MPDRHQAPTDSTDPFMAVIVFGLLTGLGALLALAAGLSWKGLLHWTGELLLLLGISLAAKGISDVRREWTHFAGFWGSTRQKVLRIRTRAGSFLWLRWNRALERRPMLARRLHLRIHLTHVHDADVGVFGETGNVNVAAPPGRVILSGNLTVEARLDQLDRLMTDVLEQLDTLSAAHEQEIRDRQTAAERERAERTTEAQAIRGSVANLAGGGLRLQAWGVACLLAGTLMTAIW
jgi:hypothetical protein